MRYVKTEAGQRALKERSPQLSSRQRLAMILFDGKNTDDQVLASTANLGVISIDIDHLLALGYISAAEEIVPRAARPVTSVEVPVPATPLVEAPAPSKSERFVRAWPMAIRLVGGLGLRGFRLKSTVAAAAGYDELVALLPAITDALGPEKVRELKEMLRS
jgi:hypothetical protein